MAIKGDTFTITLKQAHLEWGSFRHTTSRGVVYGEGYIPIPRSIAQKLNILNSNQDDIPIEYNCNSTDGFLINTKLLAAGSSRAGDPYAKQFQGSGSLQVLGQWFEDIQAQVGNQVQVSWVSPTEITIQMI